MRRTAVHWLISDLRSRSALGICWTIRDRDRCALLVPNRYGSLEFMREFRRTTLNTALESGLVVLGEHTAIPRYEYSGDRWSPDVYVKGRTIALAHELAA